MAIPARSARPGTYFVTSRTFNSRRVFQVERNAELFLDTLQHYERERNYELHAFVVMPDHIHLLLTPTGVALERAMMLIKGGFSHRLASKLPVWQKSFTDHRIRDNDDLVKHCNYIHENPVRAHICSKPEDYRFSSAFEAPAGSLLMTASS